MTLQQSIDRTAAVRTHRVTGGGDITLHVEETGDRSAQPVLFIHGISQCRLAWRKQLHSELTEDLRLVAMDLRGHGESDRPLDAYGDSALWARDVHAVITSLDLDRPILSGWSYGGVVVCDYLRHYGDDALGGLHFVGAVSRLGEPALPFLGPRFQAVIPGLFSTDAEDSVTALQTLLRLFTVGTLAPAEFYFLLGSAAIVPPHVRRELLSRTLDNDDLLARLRAPVLITHGLEDEVVLPAMAEHNSRVIPHAGVSYHPGVGHIPFWDDPDRFNAELRAFATAL